MSAPLHIDIEEARALPYASRQTLLTCIAEDMERAECIAALSRGKARREALAYAKQCNAALFQISEIDARPSQRQLKERNPMTDKPTLSAPLDSLTWPDLFGGRPTSFDLKGNMEADALIRGWLAISEQFDGAGGRYTEFRLYKLAAGDWAACVGHRSDNPGEVSYWTTRRVTTIADVMDAWNWTVPAKKIAHQQRWDVKVRL